MLKAIEDLRKKILEKIESIALSPYYNTWELKDKTAHMNYWKLVVEIVNLLEGNQIKVANYQYGIPQYIPYIDPNMSLERRDYTPTITCSNPLDPY